MSRLSAHPWLPGSPDVLSPGDFAGLRVIIIGPAETLSDDLQEVDVDDFDVVVRLNNGLRLVEAQRALFGFRTDLLFHNLRESGPRSAGAIPGDLLSRRGVKAVVYPHWRRPFDRRQFHAKREALAREGGPPLKVLPLGLMRQMRADLDDRVPTVGLAAMLFFLNSPAAEVAIHGFTFFETGYTLGYNDLVRNADDARAWVDAKGVHEPRSEKHLLRKRLSEPHVPVVTLGRNVTKYLQAD